MGTLEDVRNMQEQGKADSEIIRALREKGVSAKEISEALAQTKIKAAVSGEDSGESSETSEELEVPEQAFQQEMQAPVPGMRSMARQAMRQTQSIQQTQQSMQAPQMQENQFAGMQPSIMTDEMTQGTQEDGGEAQGTQEQLYVPPEQAQVPEYVYPETGQNYGEGYGYEQYQPTGISADTITEISEQVVSERLSDIRKELEKVLDFRTTIDAKIDYVDERLKRIERVLDRLQLSILQKVGEYATTVGDLKNELIETQKSFKTMTKRK